MSVMLRPLWFPDWRKEICVIVASGPSAKSVDISRARGEAKFIVINDSWQLAPWADMLYAGDYDWWRKWNGCKQFAGSKVTIDHQASLDFDLKQVFCNRVDSRLNFEEDGDIGWGGNSGFGALNLAVKFGCRYICLVGYDHRLDQGKHWHPDHPSGMHNPLPRNVYGWKNAMQAAGEILREKGIKVWNCSPVSALTVFDKMAFEELFP